jgi:lipoprotein-anchoring transpeptidase ErfK/SrfK
MAARRAGVAVLAVAVLASIATLVLFAGSDEASEPARPRVAPSVLSPEQVTRTPIRRSAGAPATGPLGAWLLRPVLLRDRPGGRILRSIGRRTEFGSPRVLAVVEQRPGWLGVLTNHLPNSRVGWIPITGADLIYEPYSLHADLSERTLVVRRDGRVVRRVAVAIGRPGATTPTGRFAVTDALVIGGSGGPYGCCALALTGRQPNIAQGWTGGDRLAVHGTQSDQTMGTPASNGCLRAAEADMRWLINNVPLGSPMRIVA